MAAAADTAPDPGSVAQIFPHKKKAPFGAAAEVLRQRGPVGGWQRYEEATMCQRRPADPTDPGDAADLSIMGYFRIEPAIYPRAGFVFPCTFAHGLRKINSFLTKARESLGLR